MIDSLLGINIACENFNPFGLFVIPIIIESGCSDIPKSEFGCTVDLGGLRSWYWMLVHWVSTNFEVGLDLLTWRIDQSSVSSDAYLEHYSYKRLYFSPSSLEVGDEWFSLVPPFFRAHCE